MKHLVTLLPELYSIKERDIFQGLKSPRTVNVLIISLITCCRPKDLCACILASLFQYLWLEYFHTQFPLPLASLPPPLSLVHCKHPACIFLHPQESLSFASMDPLLPSVLCQ